LSVSSAKACTGSVSVAVKAGRKTVLTRTAKLGKTCSWSLSLTFKTAKGLGSGSLNATATFTGNAAVLPKSAKSLTLKAG
jgi:hypothetical protein